MPTQDANSTTPPPGPCVETATGPVSTADLGFTLMHEHVFVLSEGVPANFPSVWDAEAYRQQAVAGLRRRKGQRRLDPRGHDCARHRT